MLTLLTIAAIPTTIGTCQGISQQKKQVAEAKRSAKFHLLATWQNDPKNEQDISAALVVLRDGKVSLKTSNDQPGHPFTGYYFKYPDENHHEGLVSTISVDPPMLNWIFVDGSTLRFRHGTRTESLGHIIGPWGWSEDEKYLTLEETEGFVAVEEDGEYNLYYDANGDLSGLPDSAQIIDIRLLRRMVAAPAHPVPQDPGVSSRYVRGKT